MTAPTPPGWYPDPSDFSRQRYFDGRQWTEHYANYATLPPPPPAGQPGPQQSPNLNKRALLAIGGIVAAFVVLGLISNVGDDEKATRTATTPTSTSRAAVTPPHETAPATAAPPSGPIEPKGVHFSTEPTAEGTVVYAEFEIADALFMSFTKSFAQQTTKEILEYSTQKYPNATRVVVQGSFPTSDVYGNSSVSDVVDVYYDRDMLAKINFEGIPNDNIWPIRDGGFVHPELTG